MQLNQQVLHQPLESAILANANLMWGGVVALYNSNLSLATDTPIKAREQDLIGRIPFAERLADILKSAAGPRIACHWFVWTLGIRQDFGYKPR